MRWTLYISEVSWEKVGLRKVTSEREHKFSFYGRGYPRVPLAPILVELDASAISRWYMRLLWHTSSK